MASYSSQESRPLRRQKMGFFGPEVYIQDPEQREDQLSLLFVKQGFEYKPLGGQTPDEECSSVVKKVTEVPLEKVTKFLTNVVTEKTKINTFQDPGPTKRKLNLNTRDNFWPATQTSRVEAWFKELAGPKPFSMLWRRVPIFNKKEEILKNLADYEIPVRRAVWLVKMTNAYQQAITDSRPRGRSRPVDPFTEWAHVIRDFLKQQLQRIIEVNVGGSTWFEVHIKYWTYGTNLARILLEDGLLDRHEFLMWFLDILEKQKLTDEMAIKLIITQIFKYLSEILQSQILSRRLAYFCGRKLTHIVDDCKFQPTSECVHPLMIELEMGMNKLVESMRCANQRGLILVLGLFMQCIVLRCPGALVWLNLPQSQSAPYLTESLMDVMPCSPSQVPMPEGDNTAVRVLIHQIEEQIEERGDLSVKKWSADKSIHANKGTTVDHLMEVLEALDRHNFNKTECSHVLNNVYKTCFPASPRDDDEDAINDEAVVELLCSWAVSTQRVGEYRALAVSKLLEKRQQLLLGFKPPVPVNARTETPMETSTEEEDIVTPAVPVFQSQLMNFLDNKAPFLEPNGNLENRQAFANLVLLFAELIKHDVFSHDRYLCTLISRGDVSDSAVRASIRSFTVGSVIGGGDGESLPASQQQQHGAGLFVKPESNKMITDQDMFMFKEEKSSPHQPGSVKSELAVSVPTPGHPLTPGVARTPGVPHTPSMIARTPGAPQTPANGGTTPVQGGHTPGMAGRVTLPMGFVTQQQGVTTAEDISLRARKHYCYVMHFPIPTNDHDGEFGTGHEASQRLILLYGVGKAREESKANTKKVLKDLLRLFHHKTSYDVSAASGFGFNEIRKREPKSYWAGYSPNTKSGEGAANWNMLRARFIALSYHDQFYITDKVSALIVQQLTQYISGASSYLPTVDHVTRILEIMEECYNVSQLMHFIFQLLTYLPAVEEHLQKNLCGLEFWYSPMMCVSCVGLLHKYHSYLLILDDCTADVFESLCKVVKHVGNPAECNGKERSILHYLYELFGTCNTVKVKYGELFSAASLKVKAALFQPVTPTIVSFTWHPEDWVDVFENPRSLMNQVINDTTELQEHLLDQRERYSFVCSAIVKIATTTDMDVLMELVCSCVELTAGFIILSSDWIGVFKTLCCPGGQQDRGFLDIQYRISKHDPLVHENFSIFLSLLLARHCFTLQSFIVHVALMSLLNGCNARGPDDPVYEGSYLTCQLLLRVCQGNPKGIRSVTDTHLLNAAQQACQIGAIVGIMKAMVVLAESVDIEPKKSDDNDVIIQSMLKSIVSDEDDDEDLLGMDFMTAKKKSEAMSLSELSKHVVKTICKEEWVREKFMKNQEELFTEEALLDGTLNPKQAQLLVRYVCYPDGLPLSHGLEEQDMGELKIDILRILKNLDIWKLRMSLLELQLMYKHAQSGASLPFLLDTLAPAVVEIFTKQMTCTPSTSHKQYKSHLPDEPVWLVAPLLSKMAPIVQTRVVKAALELLRTTNNFWTARNAIEKENYLHKSIALMSNQPFMTLLMTCLEGQDEQKEALLKSLFEQLEKFVNNTKEPQDRGIPTDDRLKLMIQESLRLRFTLIGALFDTIQRNATLTTDWCMLLTQLVSYGVVDVSLHTELFTVVLDMLSALLHGTLIADSVEESKKTIMYSNLVRKLRKELGEKRTASLDLVRQLLPLAKQHVDVIMEETHKTKKHGLQVTGKQKIPPWELLEGHKNPAPLSLSWFGAIRLDRHEQKYAEQYRQQLYHNHSMKKPPSHYLSDPPLPEEELEPTPDPKDDKMDTKHLQNSTRKKAKPVPSTQRPAAGMRATPPMNIGQNPMPPPVNTVYPMRSPMYETAPGWGAGPYASGPYANMMQSGSRTQYASSNRMYMPPRRPYVQQTQAMPPMAPMMRPGPVPQQPTTIRRRAPATFTGYENQMIAPRAQAPGYYNSGMVPMDTGSSMAAGYPQNYPQPSQQDYMMQQQYPASRYMSQMSSAPQSAQGMVNYSMNPQAANTAYGMTTQQQQQQRLQQMRREMSMHQSSQSMTAMQGMGMQQAGSQNALMQSQQNALMQGQPNNLMQGQPSAMMQGQPNALLQGQPNALMQGQPNALMQGQPNAMMMQRQMSNPGAQYQYPPY